MFVGGEVGHTEVEDYLAVRESVFKSHLKLVLRGLLSHSLVLGMGAHNLSLVEGLDGISKDHHEHLLLALSKLNA